MHVIATLLKTLGHSDRLRILSLLSQGELTVSELVEILGLSQPRVTQYIKSLEHAGVVERMREGSWVFARLKRGNDHSTAIVGATLAALPAHHELLSADLERLIKVRADRSRQAEAFFTSVANDQGQLGHEYLPQADIEAALLDLLQARTFERMVDLGTGTGRMLKLFAPHIRSGIGVDDSVEMLRVARHILSDDAFTHVSVQQADLHDAPLKDGSADLVTLHQVLHFLEDPSRAVQEAARLLSAKGHLLITDFASHELENYREDYAHRRLGFTQEDMAQFLAEAGFNLVTTRTLPAANTATPDVKVWHAISSSSAFSATG
jgi:ubiquinone/menaquinone biosynthesis C-methylase UbiE/DNA-binding transcriptional ArsR family regulator